MFYTLEGQIFRKVPRFIDYGQITKVHIAENKKKQIKGLPWAV